MITKTSFNNSTCDWINIDIDDSNELKSFYKEYDIDDEIVAYSLDRNERAHIEYEPSTNTFAIFF